MTDIDCGPLDRYEVTWRSGSVETIEANVCLLPGPPGFDDSPRHVSFHGEVNGRWKLILDADYADILSVRLLARDDVEASESSMKYRITVTGCDDDNIIDLDLTDAEVTFAKRLAEALTEASQCGCQPRMRVDPTPEDAA